MEWQQILGFYHVAKLGSFTKAAEATYRTQSALSQQVKNLEGELECRLLERIGKRKLRLTSAGERFFQFSETVLSEYDSLVEAFETSKGMLKGRLRVAAPFTTLYHLFPLALKRYIEAFPNDVINRGYSMHPMSSVVSSSPGTMSMISMRFKCFL